MEIRPSLLPALNVPLASAPALVSAWRSGQVMEAMVVASDGRGQVRLAVPGGHVEARSELPLAIGQRLTVTVERREGQWLLRPMLKPETPLLAQALRQALPRATAVFPAFELAAQLTRGDSSFPVPEPVRQLLARTLAQLPAVRDVATADGLQRAVQNTGVMLEHRLGAGLPTEGDLKAALLRLAALLRTTASIPAGTTAPTSGATFGNVPGTVPPTTPSAPASPLFPATAPDMSDASTEAGSPPRGPSHASVDSTDAKLPEPLMQLKNHVEGALARIELQQLRAQPEAPGHEPSWLLELPVRTGERLDLLQLRIERDGKQTEPGAEPAWSVVVDLSSESAGRVRAAVALRAGEISTRFFTERPETAALFCDHLNALATRLTAAGLKTGTLESHGGIPSDSPSRPPHGLLSERA